MERVFSCDSGKRALLLEARHFDLLDMAEFFADDARLDLLDDRRDYGEERRVTIGQALGGIFTVVFTVVYTMRGPVTWLITAWPANRKERARYGER
ncbi:BrnT family toxin [Methylobacterium mesophilicum]